MTRGGRGEPWQIMYTNVIMLMERMLLIHPFPLEFAELYNPLMPEFGEGNKWENLLACMNSDNIVTFVIEGPELAETVFWVYSATPHPCPASSTDGLAVHRDHPHYAEIKTWVGKMNEIAEFQGNAQLYLNRLLKQMKHPMWVEKLWPEILPFVGTVPPNMVEKMREPRPTALNRDRTFEEQIELQLAACSLLQGGEVTAGVGAGSHTRILR